MGVQRHLFPCLLVLLSFALCSTSSRQPEAYSEQESSGYLSRSFPSYFEYVRSLHFDSKLYKKFKKIRRSLATSVITVNVQSFGAKGDGTTDDTKAFEDAWEEACSSSADVNFVVPRNGNYLVRQIRFSGPCRSGITMQISGTITASNDRSAYREDLRHWLLFDRVENLVVSGGTLNGNGRIWWQNSCKIDKSKPCTVAPTALTFYDCTNLVVRNQRIVNAQQIHVSFERCNNVRASNLVVTSPEDSPNTDGIHVSRSQNVQISNSSIGTGDDCISIVTGTQNVEATDITCGPGHGISIGSLGENNLEAVVSDIVVNRAKLSGTTNGVRIKTWQGGSGSASNIKFQNIEMDDVKNPIIIDQNYCDQDEPCEEQSSNVQVKNVVYQNIRGTSASEVAISFDCSRSHPCQGIVMKNVNLEGERAVCNNVNFQNSSASFKPSCPN